MCCYCPCFSSARAIALYNANLIYAEMRALSPARRKVGEKEQLRKGLKMEEIKVVYKNIDDLHPYENNPRRNDKAVAVVAESIKAYGFKVPCIITQDGVLVTGHTRYKAAKKLGISEIPCVVADDLSEEQINEFRIADNKVGEVSQWNRGKLAVEIAKLPKFEPLKVGFKSTELFKISKGYDALHNQDKDAVNERRSNIFNLEIAQYIGEGEWDIPIIYPVEEIPEIDEWIGFNYVLNDKSSDEEKLRKGVHFFIDDYQFERVWSNPEAYVEALSKYGVVLSPDFSPYADMPMATQLFNHYRKHWVAAFWQAHNITVVPTLRGSADERGRKWWLDGEPKGGVVCISTMWDSNQWMNECAANEYQQIIRKLKPTKILVYGKKADYITFKNIEIIETFSQKRWQNGKGKQR